MENKVKLQHYVPKVYLKNFAISNKEKHFIWCFDKQTRKIFQTNIKDIAFEEEFYDKEQEDQITERALRDIETKYGQLMEVLIQAKNLDSLSTEQKIDLTRFIVYQMLRTKELRAELEEIPTKLLEKFGENIEKRFKHEIESSLEQDSLRSIQKKMILQNSQEFVDILLNMKWILIINKSIFPYWTSDNPVIMYNSIDHSPCGNLGLNKLGIEIHFPLTPKLCLIICDPLSFNREPNKKVSKDYRNIIRERDLQVRGSTRFVFSQDEHFNFARTMLQENPKLGNPDREKIRVN